MNDTRTARLLPDEFADLAEFVPMWALPTETERIRARIEHEMMEINHFAKTILPRIDSVFEYLDQFEVENLPDNAKTLFYLTLSLAELAPALESFKQQRVPNGYPIEKFRPQEKFSMRPIP